MLAAIPVYSETDTIWAVVRDTAVYAEEVLVVVLLLVPEYRKRAFLLLFSRHRLPPRARFAPIELADYTSWGSSRGATPSKSSSKLNTRSMSCRSRVATIVASVKLSDWSS